MFFTLRHFMPGTKAGVVRGRIKLNAKSMNINELMAAEVHSLWSHLNHSFFVHSLGRGTSMRAVVRPTMSPVVHEEVHHRTKQEQKKRESNQGMGGMLANQIDRRDHKKCGKC
jgi:hypothetical protein